MLAVSNKGGLNMKIALTGNPNSGKTTMYNALTGRNEKVGNWAGVTVEKKEFSIKKSYYNENEDNDILRFFAGCDIPMELETNITNTNENESQEPEDVTENASEEGKKLKFSVYLPNKYSGRFFGQKEIDDFDDDWPEYLFSGIGVNNSKDFIAHTCEEVQYYIWDFGDGSELYNQIEDAVDGRSVRWRFA